MSIYLFILIGSFISSVLTDIPTYRPIRSNINEILSINVSSTDVFIIYYNFSEFRDYESPLRLKLESIINHGDVILIVIKSGNELNSIQLWNQYNQPSVIAERTICPTLRTSNHTLVVEISTQASIISTVSISVVYVTNFMLKLGGESNKRSLTISEFTPSFYLLKLENDIENVMINVQSEDYTCMILFIQQNTCPMYDDILNMKSNGIYETVTKKGAIVLQKPKHSERFYFVVFILNKNDEICFNNNLISMIPSNASLRQKNFTVFIKEVRTDYLFPVFGAIGVYLIFYIISLIISCIYEYCCLTDISEDSENQAIVNVLEDIASYSSIAEQTDMQTMYSSRNRLNFSHAHKDLRHHSLTLQRLSKDDDIKSFDLVPDVITDPNIYRLNISTDLSDFSRKSAIILNRKYFLYFWYLVIISVFYALPVVQLVIMYQSILDNTGNQDTCYYNFHCTRPWLIFSAFNNIISNIGYVLLGILFILITLRRERLYNECKRICENKDCNYGIPQYYGLFYAMGLSLMMEGIMSACYHICPSRNNFQFDTAYMYILACLCIIKIYQTRHPDINATAHSFFMTMALFIFVGVLGVVARVVVFWVLFSIFYLFICFFITCEAYYMGRWRFNLGISRRIYNIIKNDKWKVLIPTYKRRMAVLGVLNLINISLALFGAIYRPHDFPSYFLSIFMVNLLIYFGFYIIMKVINCEKFHVISILYVIIGLICWVFAIYCFINAPTDWLEPPAESRIKNKECIFLDFYDIHDIWHFLSSFAMFFSFMALQNIDDCQFTVDRTKISVF